MICSPVYIGKTGLIRQEALNYGFDPIEEQIESITMDSGQQINMAVISIPIVSSATDITMANTGSRK